MSTPVETIERLMSEAAERVHQRRRETPFLVFICGPAVKKEAEDEQLKPGAELRRYVTDKLQRAGFLVVWGEHNVFRQAGGDSWVKGFNDADKEVQFAKESAHFVIIFPDSPGSFAELGGFGLHPQISSKLLIVFDSSHKDKGGFLVEALAKAAEVRNATIWFRNYERKLDILKAIKRKLQAAQMTRITSLGYDGR